MILSLGLGEDYEGHLTGPSAYRVGVSACSGNSTDMQKNMTL